MATDLTGLKVKDTYNSLLKIGDNSSLSATPDKISDGLGNESILYLSTSQVSIGTLPATGYDLTVNSAIKTGSIDIVGAATAATLRLTGGSGSQGTLSWNTDEETVDIIQNGATLQVGQEVQVHVKNQTGSTITDGTPVYVTGTLGSSGRLTVAPMIADGTIDAKYFLGITTEDIPNGEDGKVTTFGKIRGLDTTAYSEGQTLYVSASTAGAFQTTAPVAPNLDLEVAIVINVSANNGTIFVRAQNGYYLGLLHDVYLNSPTNNQFLVYNSTTSRWENQGIASVGSINLQSVTDNGNITNNNIIVRDTDIDGVPYMEMSESATKFLRLHHYNSGKTTSGTNIANSGLIVAGEGSTGGLVIRTDANAPIIFATNGVSASNERMRINSSGIEVNGNVVAEGSLESRKDPFGGGTSEGGGVILRKAEGTESIPYYYRYLIDNFADSLRIVREDDADGANGVVYVSVDSSGNFNLTEGDFKVGGTTVIDSSQNITAANMTLSGYLRGAANFVIDPAAYGDETGVVQILGDLRVDGTTTTINSTTVTIDDKNLVLASGSATAADANGAGLTIDGASATMTYDSASDRFVFNKNIEADLVGNVTGDLTGNADTATTWETSRTITIGDTGKSVDGSADVSWTKAEIGITKANIDALNIDADTLDSIDSERFHLSFAGTLTSGDWNDYQRHGTYKVQHANFTNDTNNPPASYSYGILSVEESEVGGENRTNQIYYPHINDNFIYQRMRNSSAWTDWRKIWRNGTGSGSTLDADTLDTKHATDFNLDYVTDNGNSTSNYIISSADTSSQTYGNFTASGTADWYMFSFDARGASAGAYGIGLRNDIVYRTMSFHIPNHAAYSSTGNIPKFGFYSNGADELFTIQSASGDVFAKGHIEANDLYTHNAIYFDRSGSNDWENIIRSQKYPSQGYTGDTGKYWLEYITKGGHHFVVNSDGGVGDSENSFDDFTIWQGAVDGDRLFSVSNVGNADVYGNLSVDNKVTITGTTNNLIIEETADGEWHIYDTFQNNGIILYSSSGGMEFQYNGSTEMIIDANGVSVIGGIDLSDANLDIGSADIIFGIDATDTGARGLVWNFDADGNGTASNIGYIRAGGTLVGEKMQFNMNAEGTITGSGTVYQFMNGGSDIVTIDSTGRITANGGVVAGSGGVASWGKAIIDVSTEAGWGATNSLPYLGSIGGTTGSSIFIHNPHVTWRTENAATGFTGRAGIRCSHNVAGSNWWDVGLAGDFFHLFRDGTGEIMRVTSDKKLGIGISPNHQIHAHVSSGEAIVNVSADGYADGFDFGISQTDGHGFVWNRENTYVHFGTNNGQAIRIHPSTRNVLIGDKTSDSGFALEVGRTVSGGVRQMIRNYQADSASYTAFHIGNDTAVNKLVMFSNSSTRTTDGGAGNSTIRTDSGNLNFGAGSSQHIFQTNGRVGINTLSAYGTLEVNAQTISYGENIVCNPSSSGYSGVFFRTEAAQGSSYTGTYAIGKGASTAAGGEQFYLIKEGLSGAGFRGDELLGFKTDGDAYFGFNVGIKNTDPKAPLHIGLGSGGDNTAQEQLRLTGDYTATNSGVLLRFTNQHDSGLNPNTGEYNLAGIKAFDYRSDWGGAISLMTAPNTSNGGDLQDRLVITPEGDIGIGTNSPDYKVDIEGTDAYLLNLNNTSSDPRLQFQTSGTARGHLSAGAGLFTMYGNSGTALRFMPNGSTAMYIATDGDVGIGTNATTPSARLSIGGTGTANDPCLAVDNSSSSSFNHSIEAFAANLTANESNLIMVGKQGNTKNTGYLGYKWKADGSDSNIVTLGHWGSDHLLCVQGNGWVGINTETPSTELQVGTSAYIGSKQLGLGALPSNTSSSICATIGVYADTYAYIDLATQNGNGSWIDFSSGNGGDYRGRIRYNNTSNHFDIFTNGSSGQTLRISSGLVQGDVSLRVTSIRDNANTRPSDGGFGGIDFYNNGIGYQYAAKYATFRSPTEWYGLTQDFDGGSAQVSVVANYSSGNIAFFTGGSTVRRMWIQNNGYVTIGASSGASEQLDVYGNIKAGATNNSSWGRAFLGSRNSWAGTQLPTLGSVGGSTGSLIFLENPHIAWQTTNAPSGFSGRASIRCATDANATYWYDVGVAGDFFHIYRSSGGELLRLTNIGALHVDNDVVAFSTTTSDARLKDDVKTIDNALDKVLAMRGVEYVWNNGSRKGQKDLGLIAQEVEEVIPEIVREHELPLMDDSGEKYKTVDYEKIVGVLIEAMKEQQKQIDELKSRLDGSTK